VKIVDYKKIDQKFFEYLDDAERETVRNIIKDVKEKGDSALRYYTAKFDGVESESFRIDDSEIEKAVRGIDPETRKVIEKAVQNIKRFAESQLAQLKEFELEIEDGVLVRQCLRPLHRIGIYVPGGRFPLVSTVLMCAVPAEVAGVKEIIMCSPPRYEGSVHPLILAAAKLTGVTEIYGLGGVQAIAAMAYGTSSIKGVDKIVGPGNKFVSRAKKEVYGKVGIDFVAGPTEILIIADDNAQPQVIAADLIAQAEHDPDAVPILVTDSDVLAQKVCKELKLQLDALSTKTVAEQSLNDNGRIILVPDIEQAIEIANHRAPEHLLLQVEDAEKYLERLDNFGSCFVGAAAAEAFGDYTSGINHTLPTNTCARYTAGLSVFDFIKLPTALKMTELGLQNLASTTMHLAQLEGLEGHHRSVKIRAEKI